jgi:Na+(H+)/acetate symporter ActP
MTHQAISFVKSALRFAGYILLVYSIGWAVGMLIVSEIVGVLEEIGH